MLKERKLDQAGRRAMAYKEGDLRKMLGHIDQSAKVLQKKMKEFHLIKSKILKKRYQESMIDLNRQLDEFIVR